MQYETMLKLWKRIFDTWGNLEIIQWVQNKTSTYKRRDMHICIHMGKTVCVCDCLPVAEAELRKVDISEGHSTDKSDI